MLASLFQRRLTGAGALDGELLPLWSVAKRFRVALAMHLRDRLFRLVIDRGNAAEECRWR